MPGGDVQGLESSGALGSGERRRVALLGRVMRIAGRRGDAVFEGSIIWDLVNAPVDLVERARITALEHIERTKHSQQ